MHKYNPISLYVSLIEMYGVIHYNEIIKGKKVKT